MPSPRVPEAISISRRSLPLEVAAALRQEIDRGRWSGVLPGERRLTQILQVSRTSLRPALEQLEKEGMLRNAHGKRREIVSTPQRRSPAGAGVVVLLSPFPLERIEPSVLLQIELLRELLERPGLSFHIETRPSCYTKRPDGALRTLAADFPAAAHILWRSTRAMQAWFLKQKTPHVILGSSHFSQAASVDLDHQATGRHAATTFFRLGHRRLAIIAPDSGLAGDLATVDGFTRAAAEAGCEASVLLHDGTPEKIARSVDRLLSLEPRPTGLLSAGGVQTIAVVTRLLERGIRIPLEISVISRDYDPTLAYVHPRLARYQRPALKFARGIVRQILHQFQPHGSPASVVRIFPDFHPGASLARP